MMRLLVVVVVALGLTLPAGGSVVDYGKPSAYINIDTSLTPVAPPADFREQACKRFVGRPGAGGQVCGKNGRTYPNAVYLRCFNRKQPADKRILVKHHGPCQKTSSFTDLPSPCETNMYYKPVCGSDNATYANREAVNCKNLENPSANVKVVREGECQPEGCPCRGDLDKVCASNGITYRNPGEVRCLKKWQPDLRITHSGGCTIREVRRAMSRRKACDLTMNRFEWNPVCGSNNLTYANAYVFICHRPRNEGRCVAKPGECGTLRQLACSRVEQINKNQLESTSLVCGSNAVTYRSYDHLHCATIYDKYLTAISAGRCTRKYDPCSKVKKPLVDGGHPVCGTDNQSYTSIEALWCVKYIGKKDLKYKHDGPCL